MNQQTQIRLALLLVIGVAAIGDVVLRELPNRILAGLNRPAASHRAAGLVLANLSPTDVH